MRERCQRRDRRAGRRSPARPGWAKAASGPLVALASVAAWALAACEPGVRPPRPPPFEAPSVERTGEPATTPSSSGATTDPERRVDEPAVASSLAPPPPDVGAARSRVFVEEPFKLGAAARPDPDLERWNRGGAGRSAVERAVEGHPDPRVVVDVESVKGAHRRDAVERDLRRMHWGHVVGCYARAAWAAPTLRGDTRLRLNVRKDGRVGGAKLLSTSLADRSVAECIVGAMRRDALGPARAGSTVVARVHVAPGDEPIAPPADRIVPGVGSVDLERLGGAIEAARPRLEACYARAVEASPGVWGRLAVRLLLVTGVDDAPPREAFEADSSFPDAALRRCVLRELRGTALPPALGGEARYVVGLRFGEPPGAQAR